MSSRIALNPRRVVVTCFALACALCLLATHASAQANQPKDEIFAGYSWLHPDGYDDLGFKVKDIVDGFDLSNTYYLPSAHNLGVLADGSGHFNSGQGTGIGYILGGLQYKYHSDTFSPFARAFVGAAHLSPRGPSNWSAAVGGGGGFDLTLNQMFSIRLAQVDYIYSNYNQKFLIGHTSQFNSIRLAAGLVVNLGNYYAPPLSCSASATPAEVWAGEPVKVTTTGTNFSPKHTVTYAWTANGGKLKKMNAATCAANFSIKQPQPPVVSCSANPTTIAIGEPSTITMTASDPQGWPLTYSWSATGGQLSGSGTTATLTATNADAGNTITVTGTASDARANLSSSCT